MNAYDIALSDIPLNDVTLNDIASHPDSPKSVQSSAEFAWMKEKKSSRKQQNQGKCKGMTLIVIVSVDRIGS